MIWRFSVLEDILPISELFIPLLQGACWIFANGFGVSHLVNAMINWNHYCAKVESSILPQAREWFSDRNVQTANMAV